jgi:hypothetical protein
MSIEPEDPFGLDLRRDLEQVDRVMTQVISDPSVAEEFVRDPSGVLTRLGLHPRTSPEIHSRVNQIFYAVITNAELVNFVLDHFASFEGPVEQNQAVLDDALARGEVEHSIELDLAAADHFFRQRDVLRRVYQLTLHDLNNRRLLQNVYSPDEIDDYVERQVEAILDRRSIREVPELERWDEHYGVGTGFGVGEAEVGPIATVGVFVEVGIAATVVIPVGFIGLARDPETLQRAARGDVRAVRMLATAGALMRLAGEILVHANQFERR